MKKDPYDILGLSPGATDEEVTKAYRRLAKKYHPDLNPGDESAAEKMSEINAAYDMIKSGYTKTEGSSAYGKGNAYGRNPFEGFGGSPFYGDFSSRDGSSDNDARIMESVRVLINNRRYHQALILLSAVRERNARWYYFSAIANYGEGNRIAALEHARIACEKDPGNEDYARLYEKLTNAGNSYSTRGESYGRPSFRLSPSCLWCCLGNFICNAFSCLGQSFMPYFFCC